MMIDRDATIKLKDGRKLAFTEHGDPDGQPIFFVHGNPSSRLMRHPDVSIVERLGARIITPDRPGYGRSDFQPDRTLLDLPADIAQLADALGIDTFAVFGVSAGGPYVAACAHKLPQRVTSAAIVSGAAPMNRPGAYDDMHSAWRAAFRSSKMLPSWMLRGPLWLQSISASQSAEQALTNFASMLSAADKAKLRRPDIRARVTKSRAEATRQGHRGWAHEAKIVMSPWGFPLEAITVPVHLWYWAGDLAIPQQMGRYLEAKLPHTIPHFMPGGGHLSIYDHWGEIIGLLIGSDQAKQTSGFGASPFLIYEDDLVFVRHVPIADGETAVYLGSLIVQAKQAAVDWANLSDEDSTAVQSLIIQLSSALETATGAEYVHQFVNNHKKKPAIIRLVPRYPGAPLAYWGSQLEEWPNAPRGKAAEIESLIEQIRALLPVQA